jgi:hypothetical protein
VFLLIYHRLAGNIRQARDKIMGHLEAHILRCPRELVKIGTKTHKLLLCIRSLQIIYRIGTCMLRIVLRATYYRRTIDYHIHSP